MWAATSTKRGIVFNVVSLCQVTSCHVLFVWSNIRFPELGKATTAESPSRGFLRRQEKHNLLFYILHTSCRRLHVCHMLLLCVSGWKRLEWIDSWCVAAVGPNTVEQWHLHTNHVRWRAAHRLVLVERETWIPAVTVIPHLKAPFRAQDETRWKLWMRLPLFRIRKSFVGQVRTRNLTLKSMRKIVVGILIERVWGQKLLRSLQLLHSLSCYGFQFQ